MPEQMNTGLVWFRSRLMWTTKSWHESICSFEFFLSQVKIRLRIIKNVMLFFNKGQFNLFLKKVHGPLIKKGKFYAYILSACKIKPSWTQSWRIQSLPGNRILWRTISPMMQPTDQISTVGKEEETRAKGRKTEVSISTHTSSGMKKDVNDWCELCYSH